MTPEEVEALGGPELAAHCAEHVPGWAGGTPAGLFNPWEDLAGALRLVERLGEADFVLHRFAGSDTAPALWMAWFGDCAQATAPTAPLAVCRAALLYALGKRQAGG